MKQNGNPNTPFLPNWDQDKAEDLEKILERHLPWIQSYVHRKLGDFWRSKADTGDIIQEAMVEFLKHGPRIRLQNDRQFRALLCRIVENVVCDKYAWFTARRRAIAKERPLPPDTILKFDPPRGSQDSPSQIVQRNEREGWLRLGLEVLDYRKREVIVLRNWENLSFAEIGERLDLSKSEARRKYLGAVNLLIETVNALQSGRLDSVLGEDLFEEAGE